MRLITFFKNEYYPKINQDNKLASIIRKSIGRKIYLNNYYNQRLVIKKISYNIFKPIRQDNHYK